LGCTAKWQSDITLGEVAALVALDDDLLGAGVLLRVISDCHFRTTGTEYDRKPGIKWSSCTEK
jgi:hypothetical protein